MYVAHSLSNLSSYTFIYYHVMTFDNQVIEYHEGLYYGLDN